MRLLFPCLFALLPAATAAAQDLLLKARTVVVAPDTQLKDGALLVRAGKVAYVGAEIPAEARSQARSVDFGEATVTAGLVDAHCWLAQEGDLTEVSSSLTPTLRAAEAFDPYQDELHACAAAGCTSAVFPPSSRNLLGGIAALVKPGRDGGTIANADLYLKASLVGPARDQERPPTSLMGACEMLRSQLQQAKAPAIGPALQPVHDVLQRSRRLVVHADSLAELDAALEVCREAGVEPILLGAADAGKCLPQIKAARAAILLAPLQLEHLPTRLELPALLEKNGIRFGFAATNPETLRLSAALAVRNGLSRRAALDALTRAPAELLDQQARIGSLRSGCDADFAVWSGDPIDLTSRLQAVYVNGVQVYPPQPRNGPSAPAASTAANAEHR
jgi:imidazolonepropionase-like amidohydrolase